MIFKYAQFVVEFSNISSWEIQNTMSKENSERIIMFSIEKWYWKILLENKGGGEWKNVLSSKNVYIFHNAIVPIL